MICKVCHRRVPKALLACPRCSESRALRALRAYQIDPLRKVLAGRAELFTRAMGGVRHVQMFGAERTYCGLPVEARNKLGFIEWDDPDALNRICKACRGELLRFADEVQRTCSVS